MLLADTWHEVNSWLYREVGQGGVKKRFLDTFESLLNLQVLFLLVHPKNRIGKYNFFVIVPQQIFQVSALYLNIYLFY